jgi:hypothetical protein
MLLWRQMFMLKATGSIHAPPDDIGRLFKFARPYTVSSPGRCNRASVTVRWPALRA